MSDTSSAYPPPPPANIPPPTYQAPAYPSPPVTVLPNYQPPPVAQPPPGYPMAAGYPQWQQGPVQPGVGAGWGVVGVLAQFEPPALWAIIAGLVTVITPFVFGRVFFFLPIIAMITGFRAIKGGKLIGGIVGIVLGAIGGLLTLFALFAPS